MARWLSFSRMWKESGPCVHGLAAVFRPCRPVFFQFLHFVDAGDLETLVGPVFEVEAPDVYIIGSKGEGFHQPVPYLAGMGGFVAVEYDFLPVPYCVRKRLDIG